ncbi:MAG: MBL fold metallo-hydrolase [Psychrosphaera sp.]|nr:MBL fold metallo-hydrolase [Psychrosphaera sp.]
MRLLLLLCCLVLTTGPLMAKVLGGTHKIKSLSQDIHVAIPRFGGANATIIINERSVTVVDPHSSPADAYALIAQIKALTDKPVQTVINTHWHGDHQGGNEAFYKTWPNVQIIAHHNTRRDIPLKAGPELKAMAGFYATFYKKAEAYLKDNSSTLNAEQQQVISDYIKAQKHFVANAQSYQYQLPNMTIDSQLTLQDKKHTIDLRYFADAHTQGDLAVHIKDEKLLIAGDLLTSPYVVARSGYPKSYAKALRELAKLDFDKLVPGHGAVLKGKAFVYFMAQFLEAIVDAAETSVSQSQSFEQALVAAQKSTVIGAFNDKIDWQVPDGLTFLSFERLVQMTLQRAYLEAKGELTGPQTH